MRPETGSRRSEGGDRKELTTKNTKNTKDAKRNFYREWTRMGANKMADTSRCSSMFFPGLFDTVASILPALVFAFVFLIQNFFVADGFGEISDAGVGDFRCAVFCHGCFFSF